MDALFSDHGWNLDLILPFFHHVFLPIFLSTPVAAHPDDDSWLWKCASNGRAKPSSLYKFFLKDESLSEDWKGWRILWRLAVPKKVKLFAWKLFHNALPTQSFLFTRHISSSAGCELCPTEEASLLHVLFLCPVAAQVWAFYLAYFSTSVTSLLDLPDLVFQAFDRASPYKQELPMLLILLWAIWRNRNCRRHPANQPPLFGRPVWP